MRITYIKDGWASELSSNGNINSKALQQFIQFTSKNIFYSDVEQQKLRKYHEKDIRRLQQWMGSEKINSSYSLQPKTFPIKFSSLSQAQKKISKLLKNDESQQPKTDKDSKSTLTSTNSKAIPKLNLKASLLTSHRNPTKQQTLVKRSLTFALKDSQIQFTDDDFSIDFQTSSSSESEQTYDSCENHITFLKDHCLLSESEDSFDPDTAFKKIKISEYIKRQSFLR